MTADVAHQAAPQTDDPGRVIQAQRAGDVGGGHFAHALADDRVRLDAPGAPELGDGHLDGEEHRLDHVNSVEVGVAGAQFLQRRPVQVAVQRGVGALQAGTEDRLQFQEATAHPPPLGALPGEDEGQAGRRATGPDPGGEAKRLLSPGVGGQAVSQLGTCGALNRQPDIVVAAADGGG